MCVAGSAERGLHYVCTLKSNSKAFHRVSFLCHGEDCHRWNVSECEGDDRENPLSLPSSTSEERLDLDGVCDLGFGAIPVEGCPDSSAAVGVAQRRGSGKIRRWEAECLWIRSAIKTGQIDQLTKILRKLNPSDVLTKGVGKGEPATISSCHALVCGLGSCERGASLRRAFVGCGSWRVKFESRTSRREARTVCSFSVRF